MIAKYYQLIERRWKITIIIICIVGWKPAHSQKQLWSIDMTKNKDFSKRLNISEPLRAHASVSFIDNFQALVSFLDDDKTNFDPPLERNRFHVLEVDTRTGAFGHELNLPTVDSRARALPVADGGFVVLAGGELTKFNADFASIATYPTPDGGTPDRKDFWLMDVTPDGSQVVLYHRKGIEEKQDLIRLNSRDLSLIRTEPLAYSQALSVSDDDYIAPRSLPPCKCNARFLTDELLVVDHDGHYSVEPASKFRIDGTLATGVDSNVGLSAKSSRLVYASAKLSGGQGVLVKSGFTAFHGKVVVLDWRRKKKIAEIGIDKPIQRPGSSFSPAVALSPDGILLVVLLDHVLTAYSLPH